MARECRHFCEGDGVAVADAPKTARPFLKWAGGKSAIVPSILPCFPKKLEKEHFYFEPFLGGGALFFALVREGRVEPRQCVLSDLNAELIETYRAVRDDVEAVIDCLRVIPDASEKTYYEVRATVDLKSPAARTARMIYLNKVGFNGLYRLNRQGKFNVPWCRNPNRVWIDEDNLRACAKVLQRVSLGCDVFQEYARLTHKGDLIYFDPPYMPASKTASFTSYTAEKFGKAEHAELAEVAAECANRGIRVVLSSADTEDARALYTPDKWTIRELEAPRAISATNKGRKPVGELLVTPKAVVPKGEKPRELFE